MAKKHREALRLIFDSVGAGERQYPFEARVQEVDNAREQVAADGTILALEALRKRPGKIELLLLAAAHAHPIALASLEAAKLSLREVKRPDVHYPAGTDLALAISRLPVMPATASAPADVVSPPDRMTELFEQLPNRTQAEHPPAPSDWVNIAFLGGRDALLAAFRAAGWQSSDQLSLRTEVRTFLALATRHAYRTAPVSTLQLFGRQPDLVFQRQNNTFAKRHHIRIWQTPAAWQGKPVWIAAATHDIGIDFSRQARTFTHKIDSDLDAERAKVLNDLRFAGYVTSVAFVDRPPVPRTSSNATGDVVRTDGRLAAVTLPG